MEIKHWHGATATNAMTHIAVAGALDEKTVCCALAAAAKTPHAQGFFFGETLGVKWDRLHRAGPSNMLLTDLAL